MINTRKVEDTNTLTEKILFNQRYTIGTLAQQYASNGNFILRITKNLFFKFTKTLHFASKNGWLSPGKQGYEVCRNESYGDYKIKVSRGAEGRVFYVLSTTSNCVEHTLVFDAQFESVYFERKKGDKFSSDTQRKEFVEDKIYAGGDLGVAERW